MTESMKNLIEQMKNLEAAMDTNANSVNPFVQVASEYKSDVQGFQDTTELYEIDLNAHSIKYA